LQLEPFGLAFDSVHGTPMQSLLERTAKELQADHDRPHSFVSILPNETFKRFDSLFLVSRFLSIFRID
jgi:hypothetical protein